MYDVPRKGDISLRSNDDFAADGATGSWPHERPEPGDAIRLQKCSPDGKLRLAYPGRILSCTDRQVRVLASWTETGSYRCFSMRKGDPVLEHFFRNHWYNVLTLWDGATAHLRGWYADICRPPCLYRSDQHWILRYEDLTLDLFVDPTLRTELVDEEAFRRHTLPHLSEEEMRGCLDAVCRLTRMAHRGTGPFAQVPKRALARRIRERSDRSRPK